MQPTSLETLETLETLEETEKIGSRELATALLKSTAQFEYLGSGMYRRAYRGPDGFVYKQNDYEGNKNGTGYNRHESRTFTVLRDQGFLWVPKFTLYDLGDHDIMVVQYLRDTFMSEINQTAQNAERYKEITAHVVDWSGYNVGMDPASDLLYLRDGGNGSY